MLLIQQSNWQHPDFPLPSYLFELFWWDTRPVLKALPHLNWLPSNWKRGGCAMKTQLLTVSLEEARFYHLHTLSFLWSLPTAGSHRSCIWNAQLMAAESKPLWAVAYIPLKVINYLWYFISLIINCHLQHFQFHDLLDRLFFFFVVVVFPK